MARIAASAMRAMLRRAEERGDPSCVGSVGLAGAVSRPLAIDLEKLRFKGAADPVRPEM
jgi:hypothetical protein